MTLDTETKFVDSYESSFRFKLNLKSTGESNTSELVFSKEVSMHTAARIPVLENTTDIVFVDPMYFELIPFLENIKITKASNSKSEELSRKFDKGYYFSKSDERVFKLSCDKGTFYTVTAGIWVYEHKCQNREVFASPAYFKNVKQTIKLN